MARLRAQAAEHEATARWLLDAIGVRQGWRVLDVGCGPIGILRLLADAVGPDGEVVGLEGEARFVEMAREEVDRLGLTNVRIVEADALSSGLERDSFDVFHNAFRAGGGDPFIGRRLPALLREAGAEAVQTHVHAYLPHTDEYRRTHLLALLDSIRPRVLASGLMDEGSLEGHRSALLTHLADPTTVVIDKLLIQSWGQKPD